MKGRLTRIYTCDIFLTSDRAMNQERNNNRDFNTCRTLMIIWFHTLVLRRPSFYRKDPETRMSQVGAAVQSEMELGVTDTFIILMTTMVSKCIPHQAPLSMGFSRQEYRSGWPFPPPGDLPNPGIKSGSFASPALAGRFFTTASPGKPYATTYQMRTLKVCSLLSDKCASIKLSF